MDIFHLLGLAGAAMAGAVAGAAVCYWPLSRVIVQLRLRLDRSEQARTGAVERSVQAREQIAQLNRAITELRRSHSHLSVQEAQREQMDKALSESEQKTLALPGRDSVQAFADTQVMGSR
jgi:TolA-binding protein